MLMALFIYYRGQINKQHSVFVVAHVVATATVKMLVSIVKMTFADAS